ncbi:MAG: peptidylprolyl isomerase [Ilumatobacter sp.]
MNRSLKMIVLPFAVASLAAGCSALDTDSVARVGDAELSEEQLAELLPLVGAADAESAQLAGASRTAISVWLEAQVFTQAYDPDGNSLDPQAIDDSTVGLNGQFPEVFPTLSDDTRDLIVRYVTLINQLPSVERPAEADVQAWFDQGPEAAGLACVSHILVDDKSDADDIVAELADADDDAAQAELFAELAADRSTDPGSGAAGGFLGCNLIEEIAETYVPPFAAAAIQAVPGQPTEPVESDFGFHVIRLDTYDQSVEALEEFYARGYVQARLAIDSADVDVDSRYGTADGVNVVALS